MFHTAYAIQVYFGVESARAGRDGVITVVEPRDFWDRNSVLAEAFCTSDERVRHAQSVLDQAQAERRRALAAFAITVGRDGTIADLMGLNEREVRTARRSVGRGVARTVAERLLSHVTKQAPMCESPTPPPVPPQAPGQFTAQGAVQGTVQGPVQASTPGTVSGTHVPASPLQEEPSATLPPQVPPPPTVPPSTPQNVTQNLSNVSSGTAYEASSPAAQNAPNDPSQSPATPQEPTTSTTGHGSTGHGTDGTNSTVIWSSSMDSVLLWSWKSGLDLQTVATELGLDVRTLLLRVQVLADDGLLTPTMPTTAQSAPGSGLTPSPTPVRRRSGRHRRHHEDAYTAFFSPNTTTFPTYVQR